MKTYKVTLDAKVSNLYTNTFETITIYAQSHRDAIERGIKIARMENKKFVRASLVK